MRSFKFYTIFLITLLLLTSTAYSAQHKVFPFYDGTTGGTAGKLDNIDACDANGKGYVLQDQDVAMGADPTNGKYLIYTFDADSAAAEVDNTIIKPDECDGVAYTGDGRWILLVSSITSLDIEMGGEDYILMGEAGSPYNAEQIAPAAALAAMVGDITTFDPCIGGDADCTDDGNDGWASTSIVNAYYTRIGDEVHYYVYVTGTGKADTEDPNVRLPFTISASTNYFIRSANCWTVNNTTQAISLGHDDTSGTELNIRNGVAIDAWTASVTRTVMCDFTYWTDD